MDTKQYIIFHIVMAFLLLISFSFRVRALEKSLVLYLPFDQVKGDTVSDQSANGFSGTLFGGVEFTSSGKYGGALSFDGSTGFVKVEDDDRLDLEGDYTVMAWAYPTAVDGKYRWIADKSNNNNDLNYILGISAENRWRFITRLLSNDLLDAVQVSTKTWYHVAGVQDESSKKVFLYVNGKMVVSKPLSGNKIKNDAYLSIGCRKDAGSPCQFFGGIIDEFAIFRRAFTEEDINKAMNGLENFLAVNPYSSLTVMWGGLKAQH